MGFNPSFGPPPMVPLIPEIDFINGIFYFHYLITKVTIINFTDKLLTLNYTLSSLRNKPEYFYQCRIDKIVGSDFAQPDRQPELLALNEVEREKFN